MLCGHAVNCVLSSDVSVCKYVQSLSVVPRTIEEWLNIVTLMRPAFVASPLRE